MTQFLFTFCFLFVVSLIANGLSALAGGGAGLLQFPALLFLGLNFATALATHKIATVALGLGATYRHLQQNRLDRKFAFCILASGLPGVLIGANIILWTPDKLAQVALGVFTIFVGGYSVFSPKLGVEQKQLNLSLIKKVIGFLGLFIIGILNGSITSGTGLFVTIWLVAWFGLSYSTAVTYTLVLVGIFWNGLGAITLAVQTEVQWNWLPPLIFGALLGGYVGAHWSIVKGSQMVKRAFEGLTFIVGGSLVWKALANAGAIYKLAS